MFPDWSYAEQLYSDLKTQLGDIDSVLFLEIVQKIFYEKGLWG